MSTDFEQLWEMMTNRFALGDWSPHGPVHWRNVEQNGLRLAVRNRADQTVVRLFAVLHDVRRENDGYDPEHGRRAAVVAEELRDEFFSISDEQMETLVEALKFHNDGQVSEDVTIGTCWDADRMDLPRVGIQPVARMMSTDLGKQFAAIGEAVFD